MTKDYTAIRISKEAKEAAENAKRDGETWDEYVRRCTENPPEVKEYVESGSVSDSSGVDIDRVIGRIDDLESQLPKKVVEELR